MPAAAVAAIQAAATLGAAKMGADATSSATRATSKAGVRAQAHEMRRDKADAQFRQQEWDDYRRRYDAWLARRQGGNREALTGRERGAAPPTGGTMRGGPPPPDPGVRPPSLADLLGFTQPTTAGMPSGMPTGTPSATGSAMPTLGESLPWNDWARWGA